MRGVEEGEEDDQRGVERQEQGLAWAQQGDDGRHPFRAGGGETRHSRRQQEQRRREDRRDHARRVQLERQEALSPPIMRLPT
jgi:hypothetical protein